MRLAAVEYLNTLPFLHGLRYHADSSKYDLVLGHPARCAELLESGAVDIALCPVGALTDFEAFQMVTDFGIGCDGPVRTVSVFSHLPLDQLSRICLYHASRSSNLLVQILNTYHWKCDIAFTWDTDASQTTGHLCIGDACFDMEEKYPYRTDLGEAWKAFTGLPFLFAAWVSLRPVPQDVVSELNAAFAAGTADLTGIALENHHRGVDPKEYLSNNISYNIDSHKREALALFLNLAHGLQPHSAYVTQSTSR